MEGYACAHAYAHGQLDGCTHQNAQCVCVCEVGRKLRSVDKFPQISGQEREVSWVKVTDTKRKKEGKEGRKEGCINLASYRCL